MKLSNLKKSKPLRIILVICCLVFRLLLTYSVLGMALDYLFPYSAIVPVNFFNNIYPPEEAEKVANGEEGEEDQRLAEIVEEQGGQSSYGDDIAGNKENEENEENEQEAVLEPNPNPVPEPVTVLCLGDSIAYGSPYGGTGYTYPVQLQVKLDAASGAGVTEVVNKGIGGYRADQVLGSVSGWLVQYDPDIVLLMIGGNDLLQETIPQTPEKLLQVVGQTTTEVQGIINIVKGHKNPDGSYSQIIISAFTPNLYEGALGSVGVAVYNSSLAGNLSGHDRYFTANWDSFYDTGTAKAKTSHMADEFHPNTFGYSVMASNWYAQVVGFL